MKDLRYASRLAALCTFLVNCSFCWLITPQANAQPKSPLGSKLTVRMKYEITAEANTELVVLDVLIPKTWPGRQKIGEISYSFKPSEVFEKDGQQYAQFQMRQFPAEIKVTIPVEVFRYDLGTARNSNDRPTETKDALKQWLVYEQYLESQSAIIQDAAKGIAGKDDEATARACFDYVVKTMNRRVFDEKEYGAARALHERRGDCSEFADVFITLCRAKGIPARVCQGYLLEPVSDTPRHDWAEVYFEKYGWVPFDPFYAHLNKRTTFHEMRPVYLYLDSQRRNGVLNQNHYWAYRFEGTGKVVLKDSFSYGK